MPSPRDIDPADASTSASAARDSWLQALKDYDARRAPLPGEHAALLGLGVLLLLSSTRSRSFVDRVLRAAAGGALIGRVASRTEGVTRAAGTLAHLAQRLRLY